MTYSTLGRPVASDARGKRLDVYLAQKFKFLNRSQWQRRIVSRQLLVNGRSAKASYRLQTDDRLTFDRPLTVVDRATSQLAILYRDPHLVAVVKPSGIVSHGHHRLANLKQLLNEQLNEQPPYAPVHRLDRETSGIVICARHRPVVSQLGKLFQDRRIYKEYLAVINGIPSRRRWRVAAPLANLPDSAIRIKNWVVEGGKEAITDFELLAQRDNQALIRARPLTGRTHQIRIHLAYHGHPIVGDKLYHADEQVFLDYFTNGLSPAILAKVQSPHLCLHNRRLQFVHPIIGKELTITSPLPEFINDWLDKASSQLRL